MTDINLFKFEGKAIEKLIDIIGKGIGTIYRPRAIRKEAEAKAYEIGIIEKAKNKALAEGKEIEFETYERLQDRLLNKELKRQNNIDNVAEIAAEELKNEKTVSEEPVSEDWTTRFFNIAEDISDEDMQMIWGRILAGEVKKPQSYSLRTLEFIKNLSKDEALTFMKVANLSLFGSGKNFVYDPDGGKFLEANFNITFSDILQLRELGLLNSNGNLELTFNAPVKDDHVSLVYFNKVIVVQRKAGGPKQTMKALVFTSVAMELLQLVQGQPELIYIKKIKSHLTSENVEVKIGDLLKMPIGQDDRITNIVDIPE